MQQPACHCEKSRQKAPADWRGFFDGLYRSETWGLPDKSDKAKKSGKKMEPERAKNSECIIEDKSYESFRSP